MAARVREMTRKYLLNKFAGKFVGQKKRWKYFKQNCSEGGPLLKLFQVSERARWNITRKGSGNLEIRENGVIRFRRKRLRIEDAHVGQGKL